VLNAQVHCQLAVFYTCGKALITAIYTAYFILRGTVTTFTKAKCAWDSGLVIVTGTEIMTPTQAGIQHPGSSLRRSLKLSNKTKGGESIPVKLIRIGR